ncbi:MAG: HAD-IC family P-type ATPase [Dehalococcoidia bacterium]
MAQDSPAQAAALPAQPLPPPPPGHTATGGLSSAEAERRAAQGLANVDTSRQRTDGDVIRSNALTFFNVLLASMIVALFAVGQFRDAFFVGMVVFANVAVSTLQELKATRTLRQLRALSAPRAHVVRDGVEREIHATGVVQGDLVHLLPGDQVVADGHVTARSAEVDEALLTGESDSVTKRPGDEVLSGSFCVAGDCYYIAERVGLDAYAVKLTADARQLVRRMTPLQLQLKRLLRALLTATGILGFALLVSYNVGDKGTFADSIRDTTALVTTVVPAGLLLGMTVAFAVGAVRVSRSGAIVQDINAVEALNYVDIICLDKTGTITANKLTVYDTTWTAGGEAYLPWIAAFTAATSGESKTAAALADAFSRHSNGAKPVANVPFNSERRWSAMTLELNGEQRTFVLGAPETILRASTGGTALDDAYRAAAERGLRGVIFAEAPFLPDPDTPLAGLRPLALVTIADVLRPEVREAFLLMADLGIEPKLISGDNPATVAALLRQLDIPVKGGYIAGDELERLNDEGFAAAVEAHSVFGRISPQLKARIVQTLRDRGHFVAMVGDGANDVLALRAADIAVAMQSGTSTARAVAGIVLRNDSFTALIRGTREATFVLGNSARLSKLFIAKSVYAYLLIFATNLLGLDFPFLPRHGALTATIALGIPAVFISISIPPPNAGRDYLRNVLRFALPAAIALAFSAMTVQFLVEGLFGRDIEEARTLSALVLGLTGIAFMVEVLGFEGASWRSLTRPVMTTLLGLLLAAGLIATVYTGPLRHFFEFVSIIWWHWIIVAAGVAAALFGQWYLSRNWQRVIGLLLAAPSEADRLRGRTAV